MKSSNTHKATGKPKIYIFCDSALTFEDRLLIYEAISNLGDLFPMCEFVNLDTVDKKEINRQAADSFLKGTFNEDGKADGSVVLDKLRNAYEVFPNAEAVILMTAKDLYASSLNLNTCYGLANYRKHVTVQSVYHYQKLHKKEKLQCIRRTMRHELGHIFKMADDLKRINTEDRYGHHCTTPGCSMRQIHSFQEKIEYGKEEERSGVYFCKYCLADLNKYFSQNK